MRAPVIQRPFFAQARTLRRPSCGCSLAMRRRHHPDIRPYLFELECRLACLEMACELQLTIIQEQCRCFNGACTTKRRK